MIPDMKLVTSQQMRELDRRTIADFGVPGEVLMERAGRGIADTLLRLARDAGRPAPSVLLVAGRGNNGGDAFVAARVLAERGVRAETWLAGREENVAGDALTHLGKMKDAGVALCELPEQEDWQAERRPAGEVDVVVDGILGTGITGEVRGTAAGAVAYVNALRDRSLVVSIDVPSGLDADVGNAAGETVTADVTGTMGLPKTGLARGDGPGHAGVVVVIDIGIPAELVAGVESDMELITLQDVRGLLKARARDAHKGVFGHALIVGGAAGYAGSVAMAAQAALRSGAGLVSLLVPSGIAGAVVAMVPEAMVHGGAETNAGSLSSNCIDTWSRKISDFDAILLGPGMTTHDQGRLLVERLLNESELPIVMDADALNVCAGRPGVIRQASAPVLITPHPGEMGRLLDCSASEVQADRLRAAERAAGEMDATVVLKGTGTIVAREGRAPHINLTGNPGMATGGTGDVLGGLIVGLVVQGLDVFDAARAGVYLHGCAGDRVAWRTSQAGLVAGDVTRELAPVLREVLPR